MIDEKINKDDRKNDWLPTNFDVLLIGVFNKHQINIFNVIEGILENQLSIIIVEMKMVKSRQRREINQVQLVHIDSEVLHVVVFITKSFEWQSRTQKVDFYLGKVIDATVMIVNFEEVIGYVMDRQVWLIVVIVD